MQANPDRFAVQAELPIALRKKLFKLDVSLKSFSDFY